MTDRVEFSRPAATASSLGDDAPDRHRFVDKRVLLTGDADLLRTENGGHCLLAALLLLPRICANVTVALPEGALLDEARAVAARIAFQRPIEFVAPGLDAGSFDSILSVGTQVSGGLPWTTFHNDGWLARVTSSAPLRAPVGQTNPISALAAASLGVADTFKRLLGLRPSRGPLFDKLCWSLATYDAGHDDDLGPPLPDTLPVDLLIGGAGAIGNGILFLLKRLPLRGRTLVVDSQVFGPENLGTCILIGPQDVGRPKVTLAKSLHDGLTMTGFHEPLETFVGRLGSEMPYPKMVIGALDSVDARYTLQDTWPDVMLDGAIGTFMCQVSRHPIECDVACARCLFRRTPGERAELAASRATGLAAERIVAAADAVVEGDDVEAAPVEKRAWLAKRVGKPICSVVSEAAIKELSSSTRAGFEPSVPFVATLASSMVVAELVKATFRFADA